MASPASAPLLQSPPSVHGQASAAVTVQIGTSSWAPLNTKRSCSACQLARSSYFGKPRSVSRAMNGTPTLQPMPATPSPLADEYESPRSACAAPRAAGIANGTLNVATPVESCAEKLSP